MTWTRRSFICTSIIASLAVNTLPIRAQSGRGEPKPDGNSNSGSDRGRPPKRVGGGDRRGQCNIPQTATNQELIALVPEQGEALSITETPTLWFYVPYAPTSPLSARFTLRDEQGRRALFAPILFPLSGTPGIIGIRLPKPLQPETSYHWYLTILCQSKAEGPGVDGWVRRVVPDSQLSQQLQQPLSLQERLDLYQKANIWYDRLTLLAEQHTSNAQAANKWRRLLQEIGLEALSQEPIVPCCRITSSQSQLPISTNGAQ
ncbi:DUF928 domain-containing protein [Leptodesmis sichuanensis]|uniref:DUF928 domain-containing protein n=1 Tax=Leptodesmis sichuanensis TaxID=2906798 RepID=UPI001F41E581|nr:DUF928 domain-containing protein [Leptodesmis sichuanensis]UIE38129.1 DUF928 domain-containing protein [Leptodesmis sichuanensis A121]